MFLSYATTLMFQIWEQGPLKDLPVDILEKAQLMLCNTIVKTLSMQSPDGSGIMGPLRSLRIVF